MWEQPNWPFLRKGPPRQEGAGYLDGQEFSDEGQEDHLLAVPHLFVVGLDASAQLPPLASIPHEDLPHGQGGKRTLESAGQTKELKNHGIINSFRESICCLLRRTRSRRVAR